ncbi:MAG: hypothetical protein L0Y66_09695 [Myxococcaceae bacterium]|nr:hypothetical protein [Myxococcaceae bacterium]
MRIRGAALGIVGLLVLGCARDVERGRRAVGGAGLAGAGAQPVDVLPGRMGGGVAAATQQGYYPLGPSITQVGAPRMLTGTGGVSLDGTVPSRLVRSGAQQVEPPAPVRARMGGDVAFIPNVHDRYGGGVSARNGQGARILGSAYVQSTDYADVAAPPAPAAGAGAQQQGAYGGAGGQGTGASQGGSGQQGGGDERMGPPGSEGPKR